MLRSELWSFLVFLVFFRLIRAQGPVQTLFPAAIPLAVKTPYLNAWYESVNNLGPLSNNWPATWAMTAVLGWECRIRVNGTTYQWMGHDGEGISGSTNVTNIQITPTRSLFVMQAGQMNITITFLSPVEPDDWVKQSIPFSYLSVEAQSLDGKSYSVQLYSDITAEWVSGDRTNSVVQWSNANTGSSIYHQVELQNPRQNVEIANQTQDGTTYFAMSSSQPGISWQIDLATTVRDEFQTNGKLANSAWTAFATIQPSFSVFAFAVDLGTIQSTASPVTWSIGYVRDPSITYTMPGGAVQQRKPYYVTQYKSVEDAVSIDAFTSDYAGAHSRAVALDQKIMNDAAKISSQYSDLVSLATRQAMSTLDFTVGTDSNNNLIPGDVKIFMKNLGTDQRVNPVEHIYAAFPMFLYLNASIGGALLQPLLETQANLTGRSFAAMDLGTTYPTASSSDAVSNQGVEQSGNMLIMALAHARISGDGALLSQYYNTTKRWADYLVSNALNSTTNQSNLDGDTTDLANTALKGIIGVKAMAEIAHALGQDSDATQYEDRASSLFNSWLSLATSSSGSHLLGGFGNQQSWSLMYNLFADKMLGLNFVTQPVIDMQTQYLSTLSMAPAPNFGLPIDSESGPFGNAAWTMFASAFVSDNNVRDNMIQTVYNHANSNLSAGVFPEIYNTTDNSIKNGGASPALGGMFAHLALTVSNQTISPGLDSGNGDGNGSRIPNNSSGSTRSSNVGAIVGGVVGGLAIVSIVAAIFVVLRKRRMQKHEEADTAEVTEHSPHHPTLTPYRQDPTLDYVPVAADTTGGFAGIGTEDMGAYDGAAISPSPDPPTKARREAMQTRTHHPAPSESVAASSNVGSQAGSASSRDLLSRRESISTTDVVGLRTEVENLRRVMQDIRAERLEPPPEYAE
ncbi:hypothetical protein V8D89_006033 [Ganoderma adspersum]